MSYKQLFSFILCSVLGISAWTQKVDMDRKLVNVNITRFPKSTKLKDLNTYTINISEPRGFLQSYNISQDIVMDKQLYIKGFQKTQAKGDFILDVVINSFITIENKGNSGSTTDKNGKKTPYYFYTLKFAIPVSVRILDKSGGILFSQDIRDKNSVQEWKSNNYSTPKEADASVKNEWDKIVNGQVSQYLNTAFNELSTLISTNFGYDSYGVWAYTYELDSKKHPEYQAYKTAFDTVKLILRSLKPGCDIPAFQHRTESTLKYFEDLVTKLSPADKEQHKLLEATLDNLMYLYFYLDNYPKYKEYADKLIALDPEEDKTQDRVKELERIYSKLKEYDVSSLYYVRPVNENPEEFITAGNMTTTTITRSDSAAPVITTTEEVFDFNQLKRHPTDIVQEGTFTNKEGVVTKGYFVTSGTNPELVFHGADQNAFFVHRVDGKNLRSETSPDKFSILDMNGRKFKTMKFKDPNNLTSKAKESVMEVKVENPKIQMLRFYTPATLFMESRDTWVFVKAENEAPITFGKKELFWKKKTKELFAGCPEILNEIENASGIMGVTEDRLIDWSKRYENCAK